MKWPEPQDGVARYARYIAQNYPHLAKYVQQDRVDMIGIINDLAGRVAWLEQWMQSQGYLTEAELPQWAKQPTESEESTNEPT